MPETSLDQLSRIRKLLERAEHPRTPEKEAEALREKAFELAARYEIDQALIRAEHAEIKEEVINRIFSLSRPFIQQVTLAYVVYTTFGCELIDISLNRQKARRYGTDPKLGRVHAFGFKSDMSQADMLLTSLILQASRSAARGYRKYIDEFEPWSCPECDNAEWQPIPMDKDWYVCTDCRHEFYSSRPPVDTPDRRSVWYRSFWIGWVNTLSPRIRNAHSRAKEEAVAEGGKGTALALRNRDLAVRSALDARYPSRTARRGGRSRGSGYGAGAEAGRTADIGQSRLGAKQKALGK